MKEVVENLRAEKATGATAMNFGSVAGHALPAVDPAKEPEGNVNFTFTLEDGTRFDVAGLGGAELRESLIGALGPDAQGIDIKTITPEQFRDAMANNAAPDAVEFMEHVESALRARVSAPKLEGTNPIVEPANYPLYIWAVIVNNNTELYAPVLASPNATPT